MGSGESDELGHIDLIITIQNRNLYGCIVGGAARS